MEFTLHYRGPLKAASQRKKRKDHKHCLRRHFHNQLKELWKLPQLSEFQDALLVPEPEVAESHTLLRRVGQYHFAPLIGSYFRLVASLEVVMLRPEPEGRIFLRSGDIDNRLKTLLDALKVPNEPAALPDNLPPPAPDETPFFCLLQDDSFITNVDIQTAHWLEPEVQDSDEVVLLLRIRTKPTRVTWGNMGLA
jgi:hypothetical protein